MLKNFIWQREDEPQNALSYVFLFINAVYGITFTFFSHTSVVTGSAFATASLLPAIWGILTLALVAGTLVTIAFRPQFLGESMGFLGVCIWGYGLAIYLITGAYFAALAIYVPQIVFWSFWYIGVKRYYKRV